jgi:PhnB protein
MGSARMSPYLSFTGQAAEAMEHYRSVFGGTVTSQTFGEFGMVEDPSDADLVMHSQLESAGGFVLMCADTPASMRSGSEGKQHHPVCLFGDDEERLRGWWDGLLEGGTVHVPLEKAPWGDQFGQLEDRFGVQWMVNISPATG